LNRGSQHNQRIIAVLIRFKNARMLWRVRLKIFGRFRLAGYESVGAEALSDISAQWYSTIFQMRRE
jgi:hypothetical protein